MPIPEYNLPTIEWRSVKKSAGLAGFVDVETTGLSPRTDEIVELAIVLFAFDWTQSNIIGVVDEYVGLREPGKKIPPQAMRIHGITDDDVQGHRIDGVKVQQIVHRAEFLVAHNASFDKGFVTRLLPFAEQKPWICSMRDVDWYGRGHTSRGLQPLLRAHGIEVTQAHRGEADVKAALTLLSMQDSSGVPYFAELLRKYTSRPDVSGERSLA